MPANPPPIIPKRADEPGETDYSSPESDDYEALSRDRIPIRSMRETDLEVMIRIDRRATNRNRSAYYRRKQREAMRESGVRVSLVAEVEGQPAGFIMARVDFGEFGRTDPEAVLDAIGVDPGYRGHGVGSALISQLVANLASLRIDRLRTELDWNDVDLIAYLDRAGFAPDQRVVLRRDLTY